LRLKIRLLHFDEGKQESSGALRNVLRIEKQPVLLMVFKWFSYHANSYSEAIPLLLPLFVCLLAGGVKIDLAHTIPSLGSVVVVAMANACPVFHAELLSLYLQKLPLNNAF
jgi:hypothetical protein